MKRATGETLGLRDPALAPHRPLVLDIGSRPHLAEVTPVGMELSTCIPGPLTECLRRAIGAFNERHETLPFGMVGAASDVADAVDRAEAFYGTPPPGVDDALLYEFFREGGVCTDMMRELNEFILAKFAGDAVLFAPGLEIVGEGGAALAQRGELGAALGDEGGVVGAATGGVLGHHRLGVSSDGRSRNFRVQVDA